jgi:nitrogen fixation protein FixH
MGTIKLVLVLGLLASAVYVGAQIIPPYFANYEFQDTLETEARMGTYSTKGDEVIRDAVFRKAQELELPLTAQDIKLQRVGPNGNATVTIEADYTVHVDLPGYPMDLHFHPASKNKSAF